MTIALATGFLGSVWGIVLIAVGSFLAWVMFKDWFLKLITGGKYQR